MVGWQGRLRPIFLGKKREMKILMIGNLSGHMSSAVKIAHERGADVSSVDSVDAGLEIIRSRGVADVGMVDVQCDIAGLVDHLKRERIHMPVVACGIEGTSSRQASQAIRAGALEYVPLPPNAELIAAVLELVSGREEDIICKDDRMVAVVEMARRVADKRASVLITGGSGTGKEVLARYIHKHSDRSGRPFVAVNCAAIPETLLESELFGHEKGAFSGAVAMRIGRFESAHRGTLLLDEISEMEPRLQAKLLRVIQEQEVDRLGGSKPIPVDVRILATSNQDLSAAVREKRFREDLYYRLNVVAIEIPLLRDRPLDVEVLARYFVESCSKENGLREKEISVGAMEKLQGHSWPGNVRELENTIHRSVLLGMGDEIGAEDVTFSRMASESDGEGEDVWVGKSVKEAEKDLILQTVGHLGDQAQASKILGISLRVLRKKLEEYSLES